MPYTRIQKLTTGSVDAAGDKTDSFTADADYVLKEIQITEQAAGTNENIQFYADIDGNPIFRPDVPAALLMPNKPDRPKLNLEFKKGSSFKYKLTNSTAAAVTCDISLVLETEVWPPAAA